MASILVRFRRDDTEVLDHAIPLMGEKAAVKDYHSDGPGVDAAPDPQHAIGSCHWIVLH